MQDCNHLRSFMSRQKKKAMTDEGEKGDEESKTSIRKRYINRRGKKGKNEKDGKE